MISKIPVYEEVTQLAYNTEVRMVLVLLLEKFFCCRQDTVGVACLNEQNRL